MFLFYLLLHSNNVFNEYNEYKFMYMNTIHIHKFGDKILYQEIFQKLTFLLIFCIFTNNFVDISYISNKVRCKKYINDYNCEYNHMKHGIFDG